MRPSEHRNSYQLGSPAKKWCFQKLKAWEMLKLWKLFDTRFQLMLLIPWQHKIKLVYQHNLTLLAKLARLWIFFLLRNIFEPTCSIMLWNFPLYRLELYAASIILGVNVAGVHEIQMKTIKKFHLLWILFQTKRPFSTQ